MDGPTLQGYSRRSKAKAADRIDGTVALAMAQNIAARYEPQTLPACLLAAQTVKSD